MSSTDAAASSNMKMVFLKSSDGETFEVEERVALQSKTICMIEDDNTIYLPNVSGKILAKVIEYCKGHVGEKKDEDIRIFDTEFVNGIDQKTLFDLLLAANYLEINSLLDLTCKTVEDFLKGFTLEAVRTLFNINNDFTEEEEAQVLRGNSWAFE